MMSTDDADAVVGADAGHGAAVVEGPARLSRAAVWSLALSAAGLLTMCVGVGGLLGLVGIYVGYRGVTAINSSDGRLGGIGLAIAGLTLGAVVLLGTLPATLVLAWQTLPLLSASVAAERRVACMRNVKAVGDACMLYSDDHGGALPVALDQLVTDGYLESEALLRCPANPGTEGKLLLAPGLWTDYVYLGAGLRVDMPDAAGMPILTDWDGGHPGEESWMAVYFMDGHVEAFAQRSVEGVRATESGAVPAPMFPEPERR